MPGTGGAGGAYRCEPRALSILTPVALRRIALGALAGLAVLITLRYWWLTTPPVNPIVPFLVMLIPLLLPTPGLLRAHRYTYKWTGFVALLYFVFGVDSIAAGGVSRVLGLFEVAASLGLFLACIAYVRSTRP